MLQGGHLGGQIDRLQVEVPPDSVGIVLIPLCFAVQTVVVGRISSQMES